jgi:hypothetical protein
MSGRDPVAHRWPLSQLDRVGAEKYGSRRIPPDWIDTFFADFGDVNPRQLHHVIAARLAQMSLAGPTALAAVPLGMPLRATGRALHCVGRQLPDTSRHNAFDCPLWSLSTRSGTIQPP